MSCCVLRLWLAACITVWTGSVLAGPAAECPASTPEGQQVFVASDTDCAEFYLCSNGVPYLLTCPGDLYFNPRTGQCDYRKNVDCDVVAPTVEPPVPISLASSGGGPSPAGRVGSTINPVCPETVGPFPVLLPNPTNCSTYFMCSGGAAVLMPCPDGLLFNNDTWTCDFPDHVVCPELSAARSTRGGPLIPSDQCPPEDGKYPVLLPNLDDCGSFYLCSHGIAVPQKCPPGLLFNNNTWNCDYPQNVDCDHSNALPPVRPISARDRRPVSLELTFDNGCPAVDGRYPVFLPNPADCSTYYMCSHGVPYLYYCPAGLQFNNHTSTCDYPWRARCKELESAIGTQGLPAGVIKMAVAAAAGGCPAVDGKYPVFLPNPADCSTYYMCSHGVPYLYYCPAGLKFNSRTSTCDYPWRARCTELESAVGTQGLPAGVIKSSVAAAASGCPAVDGKYPVFLPNPADCSTYYMCSHGVPYLYYCPAGLKFNSRTSTCDYPWRARCTETWPQ